MDGRRRDVKESRERLTESQEATQRTQTAGPAPPASASPRRLAGPRPQEVEPGVGRVHAGSQKT